MCIRSSQPCNVNFSAEYISIYWANKDILKCSTLGSLAENPRLIEQSVGRRGWNIKYVLKGGPHNEIHHNKKFIWSGYSTLACRGEGVAGDVFVPGGVVMMFLTWWSRLSA